MYLQVESARPYVKYAARASSIAAVPHYIEKVRPDSIDLLFFPFHECTGSEK